ncbi:transcription factor [Ganoderma sinense ZZ0214-1]|uniref:Transcription factor n=1 Tax=Ganoderma sinense ZZ0214-1 TaxID=1077348 RepID=A0A2G8SS22_9APHY|nr:transcription factor [Ganoderma sinense ZZ0214-1]
MPSLTMSNAGTTPTPLQLPAGYDISKLVTQLAPREYDGKTAQDGLHFISATSIYHLNITTFLPSFPETILWITLLNKLMEGAAEWAGPHIVMLAGSTQLWADFVAFETAFKAYFYAADDKEAAIAELIKLCKVQHKIGTMQDYTVKFNAIAAYTSFSAEDKCEWYHTGLPYKIKDILATSGHDTLSITKIQAVALTMDQNLLVCEEERPKQFSGGWRKKGEKAAATGKKPFTGNCFNCGKPGHHSFECKLPKKEQQAASSSGETTDLAALRAELKEIKEWLNAASVNEKREGF